MKLKSILVLAISTAAVAPAYAQVAGGGTSGKVEVASDGFTVVQNGTYKAPAAPKPLRSWHVPADAGLRQILDRWAAADGWKVYWPKSAESFDWMTEIEVSFSAVDIEDAVTKVFKALPADTGLGVEFKRANNPKLIYVSESVNKQETQL